MELKEIIKGGMLTIGITGGYATGKTTAVKILGGFGAPGISADDIVHNLYRPQSPVWKKIRKVFGQKVIAADSAINRRKLAEIVFTDEKSRYKLNSIVHPEVNREIDRLIKRKANARVRILFIEVPLLFEAGLAGKFDRIIVVYCNKKTQINRARKKDKLSLAEINKRINSQLALGQKVEMADYAVANNAGKKELRKKLKRLWTELRVRIEDGTWKRN